MTSFLNQPLVESSEKLLPALLITQIAKDNCMDFPDFLILLHLCHWFPIHVIRDFWIFSEISLFFFLDRERDRA
jgi:hypothetical protein